MRLVLEQRRHRLEHAAALDEDVLVAVDQDVGDRRVLEQGLERAETRHLVHDLGDEEVELPGVEGEALGDDPLRDDAVDLAAQLVGRQLLERGEVELLDQAPVQAHLGVEELLVRRGGRRRHGGDGGRRGLRRLDRERRRDDGRQRRDDRRGRGRRRGRLPRVHAR